MGQKSSYLAINKWSEEDRPREKMLRHGTSRLSNSELLAILIGSGSRNESAVDLSKRILLSLDNDLNALAKLNVSQLKKFRGIGEAKAVTIKAALELSRRKSLKNSRDAVRIKSSLSVFDLMWPHLGELDHEEFWIIYLNNSNRVIKQYQLSKGGITGTLVDIRLALKNAIEIGSTAMILVHNHPSGTLRPSAADKQITQKLSQASLSLDLKVLDHVIITEKAYFSFADEGLL